MAVLSLCAEDIAPPTPPIKLFSATNLLPRVQSPVDFFRQLLAMTPKERADFLTNKPPEVRERLLAKASEYQALDSDERELRLRATEVRWYLLPFFRSQSTNHADRLAKVPDEIRELVKARVDEWDALSPEFQKEFLANERTLYYFSHIDSANPPPFPPPLLGHGSNQWSADQARWNALSENERQQLTNRFNQFFQLTASEKQKRSTLCPLPSSSKWKKPCSHSTSFQDSNASNASAPSPNSPA